MSKSYFIHECFNGNIRCIDVTYKVTAHDYHNWEYDFPFDAIDEIIRKAGQEQHLYLDAGDCDDPTEVVTRFYDYTQA